MERNITEYYEPPLSGPGEYLLSGENVLHSVSLQGGGGGLGFLASC